MSELSIDPVHLNFIGTKNIKGVKVINRIEKRHIQKPRQWQKELVYI